MKKLVCAVLAMLVLAACAAPAAELEPPTEPQALEFHARIVRTHSISPDMRPTQTPVMITNPDEFAAYFVYGDYNLDMPEDVGLAIVPYTWEFFEENFLVLVYFVEPSGSIFHRVDAVLDDGEIHISRHVPESVTDDEGHWHVIIALCNSVAVREFNLIVDER